LTQNGRKDVTNLKVYADDGGFKRLLGRAEIEDDGGPVYRVYLFGAASTISAHFTVATVTHLGSGAEPPHVERAIVLSPGQRPELLPGWQPLAS
jgi:hypothetical protein